MGKLEDYRREIDAIDDKIAALYAARMAVCRKIGEEKANDCASVAVPGQGKADRQPRDRRHAGRDQDLRKTGLYGAVRYEQGLSERACPRVRPRIVRTLEKALKEERAFPVSASVACQGVEGAYSGIAAGKDLSHFVDHLF